MALNTATARALALPELLEMILLNFSQPDSPSNGLHSPFLDGTTQLFAIQRVNTKFRDVIIASKPLQDLMHLSHDTSSCPTSIYEFCITLQRAWRNAMESPTTTSEESWRNIKLNYTSPCTIVERRDVPAEFIRGTHLEGRTRSYDATFEVDEETTLGMLFEWKRELKKRTPKEHLEAWRRLNAKEEGFAMVIRTSAFSLLY